MRRARWVVWWLAVFSAFALAVALPQQVASPAGQIVFRPQAGGLLSLFRPPVADSPRLTGMAIYTDWGILKTGHHEAIGSQNEQTPKVFAQHQDSQFWREVVGKLKDREGQSYGLGYRVRYQLSDGILILQVALKAEKPFPTMQGFLATMLPFEGADQWFASTRKGWLFGDANDEGRVFQSAFAPLHPKEQTLGIVNTKTGWALQLTLVEAQPDESLDNVFIHTHSTGLGALFLAWCDGLTVKRMQAGEEWKFTAQLRFLLVDDLLPRKE